MAFAVWDAATETSTSNSTLAAGGGLAITAGVLPTTTMAAAAVASAVSGTGVANRPTPVGWFGDTIRNGLTFFATAWDTGMELGVEVARRILGGLKIG